jgi:lipopolysaccharide export system protein LptA
MKIARGATMKKLLLICTLLLTFSVVVHAQETPKKKQIELVRANHWEFAEEISPDAQRILGNVLMKHEEVLMYCDSAYLYDKSNNLHAFGNVHVKQGDTLNLYGDRLIYNATTKTAEVFDNIRMIDKDMTLTTNYLIHDIRAEISTYYNGGKIVSRQNDNVLVSKTGYYHGSSELFFFKKDVVLTNPDYVINTDSLRFDTRTEIAYFTGPTTIESKDSFIYCENGWSNTKTNVSQFNENAYIITDTQKMEGDSIHYDQNLGIGQGFMNVQITDTINNYLINGDYAIYNEKTGHSTVTKRAMLTMVDKRDSLYLHADTLFSIRDTSKSNIVYAYHKVKFFRNDLQGMCDSLIYNDTDSTIIMHFDPVLWSDENQITGDLITLYLKEGGLDKMFIDKDAFIASQADSTHYNQIKGREMTGYFREGQLYKVDVNGNGETVYFIKEESSDGDKDVGMNKVICSDITIYIDSSKVKLIKFMDVPSGVMHPQDKIPQEDMVLKGFNWDESGRPFRKEDIFIRKETPLETAATKTPETPEPTEVLKPTETPE